jgi:hypothetical protein
MKMRTHSTLSISVDRGFIRLFSPVAGSVFTLYSSNGRIVCSQPVVGEREISIKKIASGAYVAQLAGRKTMFRKMVTVGR